MALAPELDEVIGEDVPAIEEEKADSAFPDPMNEEIGELVRGLGDASKSPLNVLEAEEQLVEALGAFAHQHESPLPETATLEDAANNPAEQSGAPVDADSRECDAAANPDESPKASDARTNQDDAVELRDPFDDVLEGFSLIPQTNPIESDVTVGARSVRVSEATDHKDGNNAPLGSAVPDHQTSDRESPDRHEGLTNPATQDSDGVEHKPDFVFPDVLNTAFPDLENETGPLLAVGDDRREDSAFASANDVDPGKFDPDDILGEDRNRDLEAFEAELNRVAGGDPNQKRAVSLEPFENEAEVADGDQEQNTLTEEKEAAAEENRFASDQAMMESSSKDYEFSPPEDPGNQAEEPNSIRGGVGDIDPALNDILGSDD
jgi:hypothetical protein